MYVAVLAAWIAGCPVRAANARALMTLEGPRPAHPPVPPNVEPHLRRHYPMAHAAAGIPGEALIRLELTRLGYMTDPQVVSASEAEFGGACIAAIRAAGRWTPARGSDGSPVPTSLLFRCDFDIDWNHRRR